MLYAIIACIIYIYIYRRILFVNENINKGEITVQAIFQLIKRSFVRIVIFVLIAAIVVGLSATIFIFATKEPPTYQAVIEFNYEGVEDGLDPWGRHLDVTKIKADNIITKALIDNNFTEAERAKLKSKIKNNITIAGVVPEKIMNQILIVQEIATKNPMQLTELNNLSYTSTSYVISLVNEKDMDLDSKQCINILNSIVDFYVTDFRSTYGYNQVLGTLIAEEIDFSTYDYVELFDVYNTQIQDVLRFLEEIIVEAKSFRSTQSKLSFEDMRSRVKSILDYNIKSLETFIFDNGIASDSSIIDVKTYIEEKLSNINIQIEATQQLLADTERAMSEVFQPYYNTRKDINGNEERFLANGEIYQQYSDNFMKYQSRIVEQTTEKTLWTNRSIKFEGASTTYTPTEREEHRDKADLMLEKINQQIVMEIGYINEAVNEYIESAVLKDSITKAVSAVKAAPNNFNLKQLILVEMLAVFLAFIAAIFVTSYKEKKALSKIIVTENNTLDSNQEKQSQ